MKIKKLMIGSAILFFSLILMAILADATVFPTYDNATDCRGCHGSDVSNRHHFLAANGTFQCTDCHPIQYDNITQTYSPQVIRNCLTCHPGKNHTSVHHILASKGLFVCSDCHPMKYDNLTQTYFPYVTWDCPVCHSTVLSIQNVTPTPTPTPTPAPTPASQIVTMTNFTPSSPVNNFVGDSRNFHIIIDQTTDVIWSINGTQVQSNGSITDAGYTNTSAALGTWNVSATASNINGNVTYTWEWIVTTPPPPPVIPKINSYFPLFSPVNDSVGSSRKFGISTDQNVDIQWLINGSQVQFNGSINGSSYTNTSAILGTWNVSAIVSNINGTVMYSWVWNVYPPPIITSYAPSSPINDISGNSRTFNITTNQIVNVTWYINGTPIQSNDSITDARYTNTSASIGIWNVSAVASNDNGSTMYSWIWNVYPPPNITSYAPSSPINDTSGVSRMFNVTIDQNVNVAWYINGAQVQSNNSITDARYTNTSASIGIWNVSAVATNANGTDIQNWTWNVGSNPKPITIIDPSSGQNGWNATDTIYLNATDSSGIKNTNYSIDYGIWKNNPGSGMMSKTPIVLSDGNHSIRYYSVDNLSNVESTKTQTVKIDNTHPLITINSPVNGKVYILNQNLIANWYVNDTTSGVATATGTYQNGSTISTTSIGTKNFSVYTADNAGNTNTSNVTYYVRYKFGNFLTPIKNDGSSIFKLGNTIPVKFQLTDNNGNYITNAIVRLTVTKITSTITGKYLDTTTVSPASIGYNFTYDTNGHMYMYNLATRDMSAGTWQLRADINDGGSYSVNISLKKT